MPPTRLRRVLDAMAEHGVDVLLLGRPGNARYVSGADALALAGTRPWGPGCVVVRATGAVHLLATSDAGVPPEIVPPERLFPITWNPANLLAALGAIDGVRAARRVGIDGISPLFEQLLPSIVPDAELVDGDALLRSVRRVKEPDELTAIAAAAAVARDAWTALVAVLTPGTTVAQLRAAFLERMCRHGVTTPAFDPRVRVDGALLGSADPLPEGLVHVEAGVVRGGYEASLGRTRACGDPAGATERLRAWHDRRDEVVGRLATSPTIGALRSLDGVEVEGVGLGYEHLDDDDPIGPGTALGLLVAHDGLAGRDVVVVGDGGPAVLTA